MKIAVIVHNQIYKDARVRKESKTLKDNGFDLTLIGYGSDESFWTLIETCRTKLIKKIPYNPKRELKKFLQKINNKINFIYPFQKIFVLIGFLRPKVLYFYLKNTLIMQNRFLDKLYRYNIKNKKNIFARALEKFLIKRILGITLRTPLKLLIYLFKIYINALNSLKKFFLRSKFNKKIIKKIKIFRINLFLKKIFRNIDARYILKNVYLKYGGAYLTYPFISNIIFHNIKHIKFDVIHAHDLIALIVACRYKKLYPKTILVWDAHEIYTHLQYKTVVDNLYINYVIRTFAKKINYFITINKSIGEFYTSEFPNLPKPIILMNGTRFNPNIQENQNKANSPIRLSLNLKKDTKILLFQGGLVPNRGIEELLEASKYLENNWAIVFMGWGLLEEKIQERINENKESLDRARSQIYLIPPAPYENLAEWTMGADLGTILYKNSSLNHYYCTPNKIWEYPNANVPILCTNLFELSKIVNKYKTGYVLDKDVSGKQIAEFVNNLSNEELSRLKDNCLEFNKKENWEIYTKDLIGLYNSIKNDESK